MIHGPSLYNNLYKIPPYLSLCTDCSFMSLTRFRSQSHQLIPTHKFAIENAQRVTYNQQLCLYCDQQVTGTTIHILLQFPAPNTLPTISFSLFPNYSKLFTNQRGTLSPCTNKRPSYLPTHPQHFSKKSISPGSTLLYITLFSPT